MWSELCADARLYAALRSSGRPGIFRRVLIGVRSPGLLILAVQRMCHSYVARRGQVGWTLGTVVLRILYALGQWLVLIITKSDVAATTVIGGGVYLSDRGHLVLGPRRIGSGTLIHDRVTIGVRAGEQALPLIGENVWIGPDCVIYGDIILGDGVTVLPGSVLSMSVPAGAVAAGNPATIVRKSFDNSQLRQTLATNVDRDSLAPR